MLYEHYKNGINLGGWLSQYDCLNPAPTTGEEMAKHLKTFIREDNIAHIASMGFDHVRLPVDYRVLVKTEASLTDRDTAFSYMERCMDWCEKYHLNMIIDLHHAEGNVYGMMDAPMPLLTEEKLREQFKDIWRQIVKRFRGRKAPMLLYELLNEVSDGSGFLWNRLYQETIAEIRSIDKECWILVGSNGQNSPFCLKELNLLEDKGVFYNFHFYDPQVFTHQMAHFSEEMMLYHRKIHYPDTIEDFTEFLMKHREYLPKYHHVAMEKEVSRSAMKKLLKDALDFAVYSGRELYCGEFGVIGSADPEDAEKWLRDVREILDTYKIGHAMWNYKELDFGIVDMQNRGSGQMNSR